MKDDVNFYIKFIKAVENFPCLYDHHHADYNSKSKIKQAWKSIAEEFTENALNCKRKWRIIRSCYVRWKSGNVTKREYYLAPYLRFLDPFARSHSNTNKNQTNAEESIEFCNYDNSYVDNNIATLDDNHDEFHVLLDEEDEQHPEDIKIKRSKSSESEVYERPEKKCNMEKEPCELYLLSLTPHLQSMSERQILSFQKGVAELIEKIKYPEEVTDGD